MAAFYKPHLRRALGAGLAWCVWMVAMAATASAPVYSAPAAPADAAVGRVSLAVGPIHKVAADGSRSALRLGDLLREQERVVTGPDAMAMIVFIDQGRLALRPDTEVLIRAYRVDASGADTRLELELVRGTVRQISGQAAKLQPERYRLNTPIAAIGVRGTDFLARSVGAAVETYVHEGTIVIQPPASDCPSPARCAIWAASSASDAGALLQVSAGGQVRRSYAGADEVERIFGVRLASALQAGARSSAAGNAASTNTTPAAAVAATPAATANTAASTTASANTGTANANASGGTSGSAVVGSTSTALAGSGAAVSAQSGNAPNGASNNAPNNASNQATNNPPGAVAVAPPAAATVVIQASNLAGGWPGASTTPTVSGSSGVAGGLAEPPLAGLPVDSLTHNGLASLSRAASASALSTLAASASSNNSGSSATGSAGNSGSGSASGDASGATSGAASGASSGGTGTASGADTGGQSVGAGGSGSGSTGTAGTAPGATSPGAGNPAATQPSTGGSTNLQPPTQPAAPGTSGGAADSAPSTGSAVLPPVLPPTATDGGSTGSTTSATGGSTGSAPTNPSGSTGAAPSSPVLAPLPKTLVWARAALPTAGAPNFENLPEASAVRAQREAAVGELGAYGLWREPAAQAGVYASFRGQFSFGLALGQAVFTSALGQAQPLVVEQGSLAVNFDASVFSTSLRLAASGTVPAYLFSAQGSVGDLGVFTSRVSGSGQWLGGAFSADGKEAGYFFGAQANGGTYQGISLWTVTGDGNPLAPPNTTTGAVAGSSSAGVAGAGSSATPSTPTPSVPVTAVNPPVSTDVALLPLPKQLVWGAFEGMSLPFTLAQPYSDAKANRHPTVGDLGQFGLWRTGVNGDLNNTVKGSFSFGLAAAQTFFVPAAGAAVAATVQQASLMANFDTSTFVTRLELGGNAVPQTSLAASGSINSEGLFVSRNSDNSQVLAGAFSLDAKEAGYFFKWAVQGGQLQGLTLWGRKP